MVFQAEGRTQTKKQQADTAIQMALEGRWEEAADINQSILGSFPSDVDAYNRLGKAMTELGRFGDAKDAYMHALEIDSLNGIARKNLTRLATIPEKKGKAKAKAKGSSQKLSPEMFIEETGKTGVTALLRPNMDVANVLSTGDEVKLVHDKKGNLSVQTLSGEHLGDVESRVAGRLVKLLEGGNEYVAAISSLGEETVKVFIRESFQHSSQTGKLSFPPITATEPVRAYVKTRLVRSDSKDAVDYESDEPDEWSGASGKEDDDDSDDDEVIEDERGKIDTNEDSEE